MLAVLDVGFVLLHTTLTLFNIVGWVWHPLRKANLVTLLLTGFSWFGLGVFYGFGYCPLTHWHWMVLERLGEADLPRSYIQYLFIRLLGLELDAGLVDAGVLISFLAALAASVVLNLRDRRRRLQAANHGAAGG